jgi:hypothetical protein
MAAQAAGPNLSALELPKYSLFFSSNNRRFTLASIMRCGFIKMEMYLAITKKVRLPRSNGSTIDLTATQPVVA